MSVTIINNLKPKAVPYIFKPTPTFNTTYDSQKYWGREKEKWIEGIPGLTGTHYKYISQGHIKQGTSGKLIRPWFRDGDQLLFEDMKEARRIEHDMGVIKRREFGLTSIGAGALPHYFSRVYPGSRTIMTSCDKPRIFQMFDDKTMVYYNNLHKDIKPKILQKNQRKENVFLKMEVKYREDGEIKTTESQIYCQETTDNPSAFSTVRCIYGFYDEFPLHKKRNELLGSSMACFMDGPKKSGFLLWGGTVEQAVSIETVQALREIVGDAKGSRTIIHFVPAWMCMFMDEQGAYTNKQKGIDHINRNRERLSKLSNQSQFLAYVKNYPLTLDEALEASCKSTLPADIVKRLNEQRKIIITSNAPEAEYDLIRLADGKIKANPNPRKGNFVILSHPEPKVTYISGTDPIPFNTENLKDGNVSDYCIAIKDFTHQTYVAYYAERSLNYDYIVKNAILLQDYYSQDDKFTAAILKKCQTMLELNHGGVAKATYRALERYEMLAERPGALGIHFVTKKSSVGWFKDGKNTERAHNYLIKYLYKYTENVWLKRLIDELEVFLVENTDLLDAVLSCEMLDANLSRISEVKMKLKKVKMIPQLERDSQGRMVRVMKKLMV